MAQAIRTDEALAEIQETVGLLFALVDVFLGTFTAFAADLGLTATQAKVLFVLRPGEGVRMRELAARTHLDPSNLTAVVDRLESRDLVRRHADAADRRAKALGLTPEGERLREEFTGRLFRDPGPIGNLSRRQVRDLRGLFRAAVPDPHRP